MDILKLTSSLADYHKKAAAKNAAQKQTAAPRQNVQPAPAMVRETTNSKGYSVEISADGMRKAEETDNRLQEMINELQSRQAQLNNLQKQGEAASASGEVRAKCLKIAMRIMGGDEVPLADHEYLRKNDPELYKEAISKKIIKLDPEKHDRISEDEETENLNPAEELASVPEAAATNAAQGAGDAAPNE